MSEVRLRPELEPPSSVGRGLGVVGDGGPLPVHSIQIHEATACDAHHWSSTGDSAPCREADTSVAIERKGDGDRASCRFPIPADFSGDFRVSVMANVA